MLTLTQTIPAPECSRRPSLPAVEHGEEGVYTIHTLFHADGPEECYLFVGFEDCTWLDLKWDEGVVRRRNAAFDGRGRGEVSDIFQTTEEFAPGPFELTLQELIDMYMLPDEACGRVCNAGSFVHEYCAPLVFHP